MSVVEVVSLLSAASGILAAGCWLRVAGRTDAIGAMDQRAYRRSLGRAAVMTALALILSSCATALNVFWVS